MEKEFISVSFTTVKNSVKLFFATHNYEIEINFYLKKKGGGASIVGKATGTLVLGF